MQLIKDGEKVTIIVPPNIQVLMSGCAQISIASGGRCCALYTDGTEEFATIAKPDTENFFGLLGQIQDTRGTNQNGGVK